MDFLIFNNRHRVFVEIARQGSNINHHLMKDNIGENINPFHWFMQMFVDL
jgi:hypothetical protein